MTTEQPRSPMTSLDRFGLYSGLLGVVADIIAIALFVAGVIGPSAEGSTGEREAPAAALVVVLLVLLYSWLSLTWFLVRKNYLSEFQYRSSWNFDEDLAPIGESVRKSIYKAAAGVGLVLSPLSLLVYIIISAYASGYAVRSGKDLFSEEALLTGIFYIPLWALPIQWGFVVICIKLLMPVLYPGMER